MSEHLRLAWLTTARGPGSYGALARLLAEIDDGLPVQVAVVFVNREPGEAEATDRLLAMVRGRGVPLETLSSVRFRKARGGELSRPGEALPAWRREFDVEVAGLLAGHEFALGVMFGYMLIATEPLYSRWPFLNDHPALPEGPTGTYQEVIRELIRRGARESGCMVHLVTGDLDRGPVVSYCRYPVFDEATAPLWAACRAGETAVEDSGLFQEIRRRQVQYEQPFLCETLRAVAEQRLAVPPQRPLDLTAEVRARVAERGVAE
jgi:folate-dependent phosphoribosylglycinamide formyltransferase PurN